MWHHPISKVEPTTTRKDRPSKPLPSSVAVDSESLKTVHQNMPLPSNSNSLPKSAQSSKVKLSDSSNTSKSPHSSRARLPPPSAVNGASSGKATLNEPTTKGKTVKLSPRHNSLTRKKVAETAT